MYDLARPITAPTSILKERRARQPIFLLMNNWVTPAVAAEIWGLPVEVVLASIAEGRLISKVENGFTFIQIDADAPFRGRPHSDHPPTYSIVTAQELAALHDPPSESDGESKAIEDWRNARKRTSQLRRGPGMSGADAA
jgi:hypothetical protein